MTCARSLWPYPTIALVCLAGYACGSSQRDRLLATAALVSSAGTALEQEKQRWHDTLLADLDAAYAQCTGLPTERAVCKTAARDRILTARSTWTSRLQEAIATQRSAADAVEAADRCRREGLSCEEQQRAQAEAALSLVEQLLSEVRRAR